jgi:hypothetical protein
MSAAPTTLRIAMWSGPRNISTALMRSWGNRPDTFVCDEPLYAHYLFVTSRNHPGAGEVIANGETDWHRVAAMLTQERMEGKRIFYQKQMTHHVLPEIDRAWMGAMTNCFLIRDPAEVIISYIKKNAFPTVEDLGFLQQEDLFNWVKGYTGTIPPVIDARDLLENPQKILESLCQTIGVPFDESMLSWPPGPRETDGIWAKHWYGEVINSTGFQPYKPRVDEVPEKLRDIHDECRECYDRLFQHRLH